MIRTRSTRAVSRLISSNARSTQPLLAGPNVRVDTTLLGIEGTNWQRGNRTFIFSLLGTLFSLLLRFPSSLFLADCAKMIDIDHETRSAYSENLSIPGEEATLLEPNMDQIEGKLMSPNLTGTCASSERASDQPLSSSSSSSLPRCGQD